MNPWKLSLVLFAGSLVLTIVLWMIGLPFFFFCLIIPVIPFLWREQRMRRCPVCGWETTGSERFCPFDAAPLRNPGSDGGDRKD
jgi:hypothetical protein